MSDQTQNRVSLFVTFGWHFSHSVAHSVTCWATPVALFRIFVSLKRHRQTSSAIVACLFFAPAKPLRAVDFRMFLSSSIETFLDV